MPYLVARAGIEPATFRFSGGRSYQLSYLALLPSHRASSAGDAGCSGMPTPATPTGLEPATFAVTGRRANQLRYGAMAMP